MKTIAIIGAGISGISLAKMLEEEDVEVVVFEQRKQAGGLIACEQIQGQVFHQVGGHVFNSKNQKVLDWFWKHFDREQEFIEAKRNAKILLNGQYIGYPIENNLNKLPPELLAKVVSELLEGDTHSIHSIPTSFGSYLISTFGKTLYELYFRPYNNKIWKCDLEQVPMEWLEGKLPMPSIRQIFLNSLVQAEESEMVHSSFYYPKREGSQFIINRLSSGLDIRFNSIIENIVKTNDGWKINDNIFDSVVYCGDVRKLNTIYRGEDTLSNALWDVRNLRSNGVFNVFCEVDVVPISWLYLPDPTLKAYRIIYTGQFGEIKNADQKRTTCVVAFSGDQDIEEVREELQKLPGNLTELSYNYEANAYVVQYVDTRNKIGVIKDNLSKDQFYLLGRLAEWEYYNMDKCIERAMEVKMHLMKNKEIKIA